LCTPKLVRRHFDHAEAVGFFAHFGHCGFLISKGEIISVSMACECNKQRLMFR
jgi:hypothetical protein